ncbi:hypothetical protein [Mesorhizobium loti]|nr:hypothetical protein [Mesorhizobium loti]
MLLPRERGPRAFGNSMPTPLRDWSNYGQEPSRYIRRPSPAAIDRMMLAVDTMNHLADEGDRILVHAWSWQKARRGKFLNDFAAREGVNCRTLRRRISVLCGTMADRLNCARKPAAGASLEEIEAAEAPECAPAPLARSPAFLLAPDARPRHDPDSPELAELAKRIERGNRRREKMRRAANGSERAA